MGFHEHHAHLLLSASRTELEREFHVHLPDFREYDLPFPPESVTETSTRAISRLNRWIREFLVPLTGRSDFLRVATRSALRQAQKDDVTRFEASFGADWPAHHSQSAEECIEEIARVHQLYAPDLDFRLDLGFPRSQPAEVFEGWLSDFLKVRDHRSDLAPYFWGIDLYDVEDTQPPEAFRSLFQTARRAGLRLKAHVGEFGPAEMVWRTVETLDLDEVQHGIHASESPEVMRCLAERGTILNLAPTSNRILHAIDFSRKPDPVMLLREAGVHFTFSTDDFLLFGRSIREESSAYPFA